jgi:alanine racemase
MQYPHPAWLEIDLRQFQQNIQEIRSHIGSTLFCLPVKANAYGHGISMIAHIATISGVDYLAVSCLEEAMQLKEANIQTPILILGAFHEDQLPTLLAHNFDVTISSMHKAELVATRCRQLRKRCRVHIEVDTGMQRTGVRCSSAKALFTHLIQSPYFEVIGIYSHLASANDPDDPITHKQLGAFISLLKDPLFSSLPLIRHIANSTGTLFFREAHLDMVRPALMAFGYLPENRPGHCRAIRPCLSLKAKISYFKVVAAGEGISYGHSYVTTKSTRIVTVPVGYGDGYRRALSNCGEVLIRNRRHPIVGMICMDQFMVDIGEGEAYIGDEVVLIGRQGEQEIPLEDLAVQCNTIPYELLTGFGTRLPRVYINHP